MGELPKGWGSFAIQDLIVLNPKNADISDDANVGFIPMPLLGTDFKSTPSFENRIWHEVKKGYTHFQDGDVLLAKITPCFENGKAGIVKSLPNGIGAGSTEYFVCRVNHKILLSEYLLAYFKTQEFMRLGELGMTGSVGHKRVAKDYILESKIPLPPLNEQRRIADRLDQLLTRIDKAKEHLDRIPPLLKRFRQSVLAAATSGKLTEDWREKGVSLQIWTYRSLKNLINGIEQAGQCEVPHLDVRYKRGKNIQVSKGYQNVREWLKVSPISQVNYGTIRASRANPEGAETSVQERSDVRVVRTVDMGSHTNDAGASGDELRQCVGIKRGLLQPSAALV